MDERMTRLWAAAEAEALGRGGAAAVTKATGIRAKRILAGKAELATLREHPPTEVPQKQRIRRPGGGRKRLEEKNPALAKALDVLIDPVTRGDPESPLRWTCKSTRKLAEELSAQGHSVGATKVGEMLAAAGYSLQANSKTREGSQHPDRNAQFERISRQVKAFQAKEQPVISVDTKKKELVGDFKNVGREWQREGEPVPVRVHDFLDAELGKAIPYGVYDLLRNEGWVNVGVDHDTAEFAVESIRRWWKHMGKKAYPSATDLLVTADGGGSNGSRTRLWKVELQRFADESRLNIQVSHYPPGTSKWNKIEHRMFCHITQNWRGRPLESLETVVNLIGSTTTAAGLRIRAGLDKNRYAKGIAVTDEEMAALNVQIARVRGEWSYLIKPRPLK
ncbi:MAG: ISAzo13 family transposase [Anaeromyxobacteraceae bacterium]